MRKLNWEIVLSNLAEAREQLEQVELRVQAGNPPAGGEFQIMPEHAYHHLNFAWNVRRVTTGRYSRLTEDEFNRWSRFPKELEESRIIGS
jgi:hypothetical protein